MHRKSMRFEDGQAPPKHERDIECSADGCECTAYDKQENE